MLWRRTISGEQLLPLRARHALLRDQLEAVAGGAGVEGLVAPSAGGGVSGAFVARGESLLGDCGRNPHQSRNRRQTRNASSPNQHRDAVHRVAAVALRFQKPAWCGCIAPFESVWRAEISKYPSLGSFTLALQRCQSYLFFCFSSFAFCQLAPKSVETSTGLHGEIAGPRGAAQFQLLGARRDLRAVRRIGDDRAHRHQFENLEVLRIALVARHHRLDGDAIGEFRSCPGRHAPCRGW